MKHRLMHCTDNKIKLEKVRAVVVFKMWIVSPLTVEVAELCRSRLKVLPTNAILQRREISHGIARPKIQCEMNTMFLNWILLL